MRNVEFRETLTRFVFVCHSEGAKRPWESHKAVQNSSDNGIDDWGIATACRIAAPPLGRLRASQ